MFYTGQTINKRYKISELLGVSSILDLDKLLEKIMDSVLEHVGAEKGLLFLYNEDTGDDGFGCKDIKKGFGLNGMEQRIKELNGSIRFHSGDSGGFTVELNLPL